MSSEHHRWGWVVVGACVALVAVAAFVWQSMTSSNPDDGQASAAPTMTGVPADQRLTWAPPVLTSPTTITLGDTDGAINLDPGKDYVIALPPRPLKVPGGLRIVGGRNVVMIGGEISVPTVAEAPDPKLRRALFLKDQTGTIHLEGIRLSGDLSEGIDLDQRAGGTVQLQNILVDTVQGTREANHADVVQSWAGPDVLRIDGLQGSTTYQGFFLLPSQFGDQVPTSYDIRRVVLTSAGADGTAGYLLWTQKDATWLRTQDILLVDSRTDITRLTMPDNTWVDGVSLEPDDAGAVLPAGEAGVGYRSPGYQGSGS